MATITVNQGQWFTINGANLYNLGNTDHKFVGTMTLHLQSNSFSGSVQVQARVWPSFHDVPTPPTVTPVPHAYISNYLNGVAAASAALVNTAITTTSLIMVPATGVQVWLDCTSFISGSMDVFWEPSAGAAV